MRQNNKGPKSLTVEVTGADSDDMIVGTSGNDVLYGMGGNDYIIGGYGSDVLYGGDGNDVLWGYNEWGVSDALYGGAGADTFLFDHPGESLDQNGKRDVIGDLEATDKIDLSSSYFSGIGWDDITIEATNSGWRVHVDFALDALDMGIDVVGVMPTEDNFVFGS
jgi:Ca2+-binding RTX toxin-like protein